MKKKCPSCKKKTLKSNGSAHVTANDTAYDVQFERCKCGYSNQKEVNHSQK